MYGSWMNIRWMCVVTMIFLGSFEAQANDAYVVIDAMRYPLSAIQPKLIAVREVRSRKEIHLPTGDALLALRPGDYYVDHIDSDLHVADLNAVQTAFDLESGYIPKKAVRFSVVPETITYVGLFRQEKTKIRLLPAKDIFGWACSTDAGVFARLPVRIKLADGSCKHVKIRCDV